MNSGSLKRMRARATLFFCPPESRETGFSKSVRFRRKRISCTLASMSHAFKASKSCNAICKASSSFGWSIANLYFRTALNCGSALSNVASNKLCPTEKSGSCSKNAERILLFIQTLAFSPSTPSIPPTTLNKVDLPEPFLAIRAIFWPFVTCKERLSNNTFSPYVLVIFSRER